MPLLTNSNNLGLFFNLNIYGTSSKTADFLNTHKKYKIQVLMSKTMMKLFFFLSYLMLNMLKKMLLKTSMTQFFIISTTSDLKNIFITKGTLNMVIFQYYPEENRIRVILPNFVSYWHSKLVTKGRAALNRNLLVYINRVIISCESSFNTSLRGISALLIRMRFM